VEPSVFRRTLAAARRRWIVVVLCIVACPMAVYVWASRHPDTYTATASLLFRAPEEQTGTLRTKFFADTLDRNRRSATNLQLVSLHSVAARAARSLGPGATAATVEDAMKVAGEPASDLISISGNSSYPPQAAKIANAVANSYIAFRKEANRLRIREAQDLLARRLADLPPGERDSVRGKTLRKQQVELEREQSIQAGDAEIVEAAATPTAPSNTSPKRFTALGLVAGFALALLAILLLERIDRRVRDSDEATDVMGFPELAELKGPSPSDALPPGSLAWGEVVRASGDQPFRFLVVTTSSKEQPAPTLLHGLREAAQRDGVEATVADATDTMGHPPEVARRLIELAGEAGIVLLLASPLLILELTQLDPTGVMVVVTIRPGITRYRAAKDLKQSLTAVRRLVVGLVVVLDRRRWAAMRVG